MPEPVYCARCRKTWKPKVGKDWIQRCRYCGNMVSTRVKQEASR